MKYRTPAAPQQLLDEAQRLQGLRLQDLVAGDDARVQALSRSQDGWHIDFSKERLSVDAWRSLLQHAEDANLPAWIGALFAGEKINLSEARPALHSALRQTGDAPVVVDGHDVLPLIRSTQLRMRALAQGIRSGARRGSSGQPFTDIVHLGIGGSDLGPRLVCDALAEAPAAGVPRIHFVSNVDPAPLARALQGLVPASTLFVVTSKTFTTLETITNAHAARTWLVAALPNHDISAHFVAATANVDAAAAFGIARDDVLPLWDWVGGRYSLWSAAGLAIPLALGWPAFAGLLAGAARMDGHFRSAPLATNLPVLAGLVGYWNARVLNHRQRVVVPYAQRLAALPAYLQQLVLESNGKSVTRDGEPVAGPTAPAVWGATGTDSQHAFFQWLHQGTDAVPVEFVVPLRATHPIGQQQSQLVANALAQAQALLEGRVDGGLREALSPHLSGAALEAAIAARRCLGNRPSTTLLLPCLDAVELGALLAFYEHRTFVEATLFGINAFDQWGVELGKQLAAPIAAALLGEAPLPPGTDASTRALFAIARRALDESGAP
ncbi:MAG: glucose-6-phosphate isomerase [Casimicrobiaceae bacterium]